MIPFERCHLSQTLLSITGTSTACSVFGLNREPGLSAPQPAAHPNFPRNSSFFSGKQIGAKMWKQLVTRQIPQINSKTLTDVRHVMHGSLERQHRNIKAICLRCEFEVWMHIYLPNAKCVCWQRLNRRVDDIITCVRACIMIMSNWLAPQQQITHRVLHELVVEWLAQRNDRLNGGIWTRGKIVFTKSSASGLGIFERVWGLCKWFILVNTCHDMSSTD